MRRAAATFPSMNMEGKRSLLRMVGEGLQFLSPA